MKDIAIYGAGGFGREVACLINKINEKASQWCLIGFFDDGISIGIENEYGEVIGGINELNSYDKELFVVMAIAAPKIVSNIISRITNSYIKFPNIISPDIIFLDENNYSMGVGNIICSGCLISCNVKIGSYNIFNGFVAVGHDTTIDNFNSFMPAVKISGEVTVGDRNFFGVGSLVLQQIKIGNDTTIGANSLIIRKTKDGLTYVGSPATIVRY